MSQFKSLIVIPTLNEKNNLDKLIPTIFQKVGFAHLLFVDDASQDGTPDLIKSHHDFGRKLFLIERPRKMGLGTAYVTGFKWALQRDYDTIFEMDADLSHDPHELPRFLEQIAQGYDLVIGSRYIHGVRVLNWPIDRLFLSLGAAQYVRLITGLPITDPTGGFKCFRRKVLEQIDLDAIRSNGYSFQIELSYQAWLAGFKIKEIPITFEDRHNGTSKMSPQIAREAFWMVWKLAAQNRFQR
ncbi:polyprenol monophosphomannose synthase [Kamptonema cortianum]|nr:polyprenol monophosphomannose synthase [Oscillatoria laete-virens]MDK3160244.1 polyprenol monophosphomannose synthase [Kamptonema cortianum]MDL5048402.1 polyprenol monophosphomannose synthase [Oscillatoria amoena NRMC-F 0135]MDL5055689.1 polyprenol monophosphomannose synthase [Oscillatoria laete-virens NRMC-F 0139]